MRTTLPPPDDDLGEWVERVTADADDEVAEFRWRMTTREALATFEFLEELRSGDTLSFGVWLTVEQLAAQIGQSVGATRRLLQQELVPGARRIDPLNLRSKFLIPTDAGARYLQQFERSHR